MALDFDSLNLASRHVCELAGISYRQLDYWARVGYLPPARGHLAGTGNRRTWTYQQAVVAATIGQLNRCGAMPSNFRELIDALAGMDPIGGTVFVSRGGRVALSMPRDYEESCWWFVNVDALVQMVRAQLEDWAARACGCTRMDDGTPAYDDRRCPVHGLPRRPGA